MLTSIRRLLIIDLVVAWKTTTILTPLLVFIVIVGFAQHSEVGVVVFVVAYVVVVVVV